MDFTSFTEVKPWMLAGICLGMIAIIAAVRQAWCWAFE